MSTAATRLAYVHAPLHPELQSAVIEALHAAGAGEARSGSLLLVVPTHLLGTHLARVHARRHGVTFALRTLSWAGLATELTAKERRAERRDHLTREAPGWLARQLVQRRGRAPSTFDALLDMRGFRAALLRTFEELGRAGLAGGAEVERLLVRCGTELPPRVRHALDLYLAYRQTFEAAHDDAASLLARAAQAPPGSSATTLATSSLWIYGFESLDRLELRLLAALARDPGLELRVFVPRTGREPPRLVAELAGLGFEPLGAAEPPALHLPPEILGLSVPGEEPEADEVARALLAAAGAGIAFRDMAVVTRTPRRLDLLRSTLERHGIPCWDATGRALQSRRAGRALLFWLELLEAGLMPDAVMAFLCVAPLRWREWGGITGDPVPSAWERAARDAFLGRGLDDWRNKLEQQRQEQERRSEQLEAEGEPAQRARAAAAASADLLNLATALQAEAARFPEHGRWGEFVDAARALLDRAFEPGSETEALGQALERLRALDGLGGGGSLARADFRDAVRNALAEARLGDVGFQELPGVTLGTAAALYGVDFEVVCLAGLQESEWPGQALEDPVLLESGRAALAAALGDAAALPPRSRAIERDRALFWGAAGAARRRLVLCFARLDPDTGAARLPSSLVLELAERRAGRSLDFVELERLPWVERVPLHRPQPPAGLPLLGLPEHDTIFAAALPPLTATRYVHALGGFAARGLLVDRLRHRRRRFTRADGVLRSPAARRALAAQFAAAPYSATQLATYVTCPFRFFMRHVLRLEPLERDDRRELSELEVGRLVHRILESFYRHLQPRGGGGMWDPAAAPEARRRMLAAAETVFAAVEARGQTGARLLWQVRKQRLREDLLRFLRLEMQRPSGGWEPYAFERRFGPGTGLEPRLERRGRAVVLRGSIDRLDEHGSVERRDRQPAHAGVGGFESSARPGVHESASSSRTTGASSSSAPLASSRPKSGSARKRRVWPPLALASARRPMRTSHTPR